MAVPINLVLLCDSAEESENILSLLHEGEFTLTVNLEDNEFDYRSYLNSQVKLKLADYQNTGASDYISKDELKRLPSLVKQALDISESPKCEAGEVEKCNSFLTDLQQRLFSQATELKKQRQQRQAESIRREKVEAALKKSEKQLRMLITKNPDGIVVIDKQGIVRFINPAALKLFNRKEEELLGEVFGFPVAGEDKSEVDISTGTGKELIAQMRVVIVDWLGKPAN